MVPFLKILRLYMSLASLHIPPAYPLIPLFTLFYNYLPFRAGETVYKIFLPTCQHKKAKKIKFFGSFSQLFEKLYFFVWRSSRTESRRRFLFFNLYQAQ